jgi:magnesium transporter
MNFEFMPELSWKFGYPVIIAAMLVIGILLGIYFKKKHWL